MIEKELSKTKYINHMHLLTGLPKVFIKANMTINEAMQSYELTAGMFEYETWIHDERIYTTFSAENTAHCSWFHNKKTLEYDYEYTEKHRKDDGGFLEENDR